MRAAELEGRVVAAIEARRAGKVAPEDDFVECKGSWPDKGKARQLAGLANRAAGEPVVLIIGFDDRTGSIADPGPTDPADWWQATSGQFDETPPDLLRHLVVHISGREKVHAFAFGTDRVPYVVKNGQGRDVPIRDGTSTRSAYRHELLRLLLPAIATPPATMLQAHVTVEWRAAKEAVEEFGVTHGAEAERCDMSGTFTVFIEHPRSSFVTLPTHGMRGRLTVADVELPIGVGFHADRDTHQPVSTYGIELRHDCAVVTGSGSLHAWFDGSVPLEDLERIKNAERARVDVELDVVSATQPIRCSADLTTVVSSRAHLPDLPDAPWKILAEFGLNH